MIEKILTGIVALISMIALIGAAALFGGTLVWLLWDVIGIVFPTLISNGHVSPTIEWWTAVKITWLIGILIKSNISSK